ncbi:hypothetical protein ANCCAN_08536 [Ancylostoma caninum]|uniref:Uncharacterized protein n=1 Tax=Ancylostoma caninum TaxID=29170 RepID=A0A368GQ97_ANCCA|nr:hypothetical protein ANCCAN_08536 [Ancylostoma caninum]
MLSASIWLCEHLQLGVLHHMSSPFCKEMNARFRSCVFVSRCFFLFECVIALPASPVSPLLRNISYCFSVFLQTLAISAFRSFFYHLLSRIWFVFFPRLVALNRTPSHHGTSPPPSTCFT